MAEGLRQLGIVGGGRVASALAASLADRLDVLVHARRPERLRLSPQAPAPTLVSDLADLAACPVLVVAVSDGAILSANNFYVIRDLAVYRLSSIVVRQHRHRIDLLTCNY